MTTPHPSDPDALDALASAHLDERTTAAEAARIAADPELRARVDAMARARAALRAEQLHIDPDHRDAAIAAALATFDDDRAGVELPPTAPVLALPARAHPWTSPRLRLVAVAAAVLLLALAVPLVSRLGDGDRADHETASELDADAGAGRSSDQAAVAEDAAGGGAAPTASAAQPDLGRHADLDSLVAAARAVAADGATYAVPSTVAGADAAPDAGCTPSMPAGSSVVLQATATLGEAPVVVTVYEGSDGARRLVATDPDDCSTVATASL